MVELSANVESLLEILRLFIENETRAQISAPDSNQLGGTGKTRASRRSPSHTLDQGESTRGKNTGAAVRWTASLTTEKSQLGQKKSARNFYSYHLK